MNEVTLARIVTEAEETRVLATPQFAVAPNEAVSLYRKTIALLQPIIDFAHTNSTKNNQTLVLGVGQAFLGTVSTYTSLANRPEDKSKVPYYIQMAEATLADPSLTKCLPTLFSLNISIHGNPLLWEAEFERLKARIEERRLPPNPTAAITHYDKSLNVCLIHYQKAMKMHNRPLSQTSMLLYGTFFLERARHFPQTALNDMAVAMGIVMAIYSELQDLEKVEATIGRVLEWCIINNVAADHPTYKMAQILYLELAQKTSKKDLFIARLQQARAAKMALPNDFLDTLEQIVG